MLEHRKRRLTTSQALVNAALRVDLGSAIAASPMLDDVPASPAHPLLALALPRSTQPMMNFPNRL